MFIRLLYANNRTKIAKITENGKRKTENFCFSFGAKSGTDDKPRAEGACALCRGAKEEKPTKWD